MGKYFGTDGIRGRASEQFPPLFVFKLGLAVAKTLAITDAPSQPLVVIGKDTRISGDYLEAALSSGLAAGGCNVLSLGVIPTPGVAIMTRELSAAVGVVISASHNPYYDNGIKFFNHEGFKLPDQVELEIEQTLEALPDVFAIDDEHLGKIDTYPQADQQYCAYLTQQLKPTLNGLTIVVDSAHGAASHIAAPLLKSLGANIISIGDEPTGCNINLGYGSTHTDKLAAKVVETKADLGLAFDGDADRLLAIDEQGQEVDGDQLIAIIAKDMLAKGELKAGEVVVTQMSNMGLRLAMQQLGLTTFETKVGDRYVLERMLGSGANIGGEQSGHIILRNYNTTGDGLAAALRLLSILVESKQPLSVLSKVMNKMPQHLINPTVKDKQSWQQDEEILAKIAAAEQKLAGRGRVVIRPSGTEPKIRVMVEGEDYPLVKQLAEELAALIEQKMN